MTSHIVTPSYYFLNVLKRDILNLIGGLTLTLILSLTLTLILNLIGVWKT